MAATDGIQVSTLVLTESAAMMRNINNDLEQRLMDINKTMQELEDSWRSEAATDIRDAMNALVPRFEDYKKIVESYAKFLVNTAQNYESTEAMVKNSAAAFK